MVQVINLCVAFVVGCLDSGVACYTESAALSLKHYAGSEGQIRRSQAGQNAHSGAGVLRDTTAGQHYTNARETIKTYLETAEKTGQKAVSPADVSRIQQQRAWDAAAELRRGVTALVGRLLQDLKSASTEFCATHEANFRAFKNQCGRIEEDNPNRRARSSKIQTDLPDNLLQMVYMMAFFGEAQARRAIRSPRSATTNADIISFSQRYLQGENLRNLRSAFDEESEDLLPVFRVIQMVNSGFGQRITGIFLQLKLWSTYSDLREHMQHLATSRTMQEHGSAALTRTEFNESVTATQNFCNSVALHEKGGDDELVTLATFRVQQNQWLIEDFDRSQRDLARGVQQNNFLYLNLLKDAKEPSDFFSQAAPQHGLQSDLPPRTIGSPQIVARHLRSPTRKSSSRASSVGTARPGRVGRPDRARPAMYTGVHENLELLRRHHFIVDEPAMFWWAAKRVQELVREDVVAKMVSQIPQNLPAGSLSPDAFPGSTFAAEFVSNLKEYTAEHGEASLRPFLKQMLFLEKSLPPYKKYKKGAFLSLFSQVRADSNGSWDSWFNAYENAFNDYPFQLKLLRIRAQTMNDKALCDRLTWLLKKRNELAHGGQEVEQEEFETFARTVKDCIAEFARLEPSCRMIDSAALSNVVDAFSSVADGTHAALLDEAAAQWKQMLSAFDLNYAQHRCRGEDDGVKTNLLQDFGAAAA